MTQQNLSSVSQYLVHKPFTSQSLKIHPKMQTPGLPPRPATRNSQQTAFQTRPQGDS